MSEIKVKVQRLAHAAGLPLPEYMSGEAAGMDLRAAVEKPVTIRPGERCLIPTGFIVSLPKGTEGQVRPRSGLALREGITLANAPGTIDSDYRGEVKLVLINHGSDAFTVSRGDRLAQLVVAPVLRCLIEEAESLDQTVRGEGGFGHTDSARARGPGTREGSA